MNYINNEVEKTKNKVKIHQLINFDVKPETLVKVSIVVPVCNVELYLRECLDSCVNQTLKDIEIICVNDGSKDSSLQILMEYAAADNRVKVIDKDNAGYGHTMNIGMDMAQGEYIGIVESDDFVELDMYESLYNIAKRNSLDFVKADFNRFVYDENGNLKKSPNRVAGRYPELYNKVLNPKDKPIVFNFVMQTWSGIYSREFLQKNNIRHHETPGASYQDNGFWFQTFMFADRIYFYDKQFYMNRRDNPNSSVHNREKVYCMNEEYAFIKNILLGYPALYDKFKYAYTRKKFANYLFTYRRIGDEFKHEYVQSIQAELLKAVSDNEIKWDIIDPVEQVELRMILNNPDDFEELEKWKNTDDKNDAPESKVKVSVIIPVYNGAQYLDECLKSVANQTLKNIEVICIDDGSEDESLSILNKYQHKDKRFTVLQQDHLGGGAARNKGLKIAKGEYLSFLDCDDFFEKDLLERLYSQCKKTNADIGVCKVRIYDNKTKDTSIDKNSFAVNNIPKKEVFASYELRNCIFSTFQTWAWNKLFKRSFIQKEDIQFQEIMRTNDMFFVNKALIRARRITAVPAALVNYRVGTASNCQSTNSLYPKDFLLALMRLKEEIYNYPNEIIRNLYLISFENLAVKSCIYNLNSLNEPHAYAALYKYLHTYAFSEQGIDLKRINEKNIYKENKDKYRECLKILKFDFEEYMYDKLFFYRNQQVKMKELQVQIEKTDKKKRDLRIERLEKEISVLKDRLDDEKNNYRTKYLLLRASLSFRIGYFITSVPRNIRNYYKKKKENKVR